MTWWPFQRWPHLKVACITTYISLNWISHEWKRCGYLVENHLSPNTPPRPLVLLTCSMGFWGLSRWMPFKGHAYVDHHWMSEHVYANMYFWANLFENVIENFIKPWWMNGHVVPLGNRTVGILLALGLPSACNFCGLAFPENKCASNWVSLKGDVPPLLKNLAPDPGIPEISLAWLSWLAGNTGPVLLPGPCSRLLLHQPFHWRLMA